MISCPFCGVGEEELCTQHNGSGQGWVQCICGASGPIDDNPIGGWDHRASPWISAEIRPPKNIWVLGMCKMTAEILKDQPPVVFQVKYQDHCGWSDWCGDLETDLDWIVQKWMVIPSDA